MTPAGRGVVVFLMLSGIALFGVLTANVAAFLLERGPSTQEAQQSELSPTDERLDEVLTRLASLERAVSSLADARSSADNDDRSRAASGS